jgi:hypothetical protein
MKLSKQIMKILIVYGLMAGVVTGLVFGSAYYAQVRPYGSQCDVSANSKVIKIKRILQE